MHASPVVQQTWSRRPELLKTAVPTRRQVEPAQINPIAREEHAPVRRTATYVFERFARGRIGETH
jgi:hypothetical protein